MNKLRIGTIGLGGRGHGMTCNLLEMDDVDVVAVCDLYSDRVERMCAKAVDMGRTRPTGYTDPEAFMAHDMDAVVVMTSWQTHSALAVMAMKAGKHAATEVGCAASVEEGWDLVRTSRDTGKQCMLLENCCYGREEMTLKHMIHQGVFGELIHMQCGYEHDLREEVGNGYINRHYRIDNYLLRNQDLYPTHGLGPVAQMLDINRGNRFISLTSTSSKARGMEAWLEEKGEDKSLIGRRFNQGDIVTTVIKCANGETVVVTHDTTLPRPYSRGLRVQGTKGIYMEDGHTIFIEGVTPQYSGSWTHDWEEFAPYMDKYEHPLWQWYKSAGIRGGHDGMDYLVLRAFVEAIQDGKPVPIDAYDAATWLTIAALSEQSIATGSMPVAVPDYTNGLWTVRK